MNAALPGVHLLTGGARSGKSREALRRAESVPGPIDFVATAEAGDEEMAERIVRHRAERGPRYRTHEAPLALEAVLAGLPPGGAVVVDCLTLWCANLLFSGLDEEAMYARFAALPLALAATGRPTLVVTNEVGLGIVPGDPLSRRYRDLLGRLNQEVAVRADGVVFMVAGLPMVVR